MNDKAGEEQATPQILGVTQPQIEETPPPVPPKYQHVFGKRIRRHSDLSGSAFAKCAVCGSELESGANYCVRCGTPVVLFCPYCGRNLPARGEYCDRCGRLVREPATPSGMTRLR